MTDALNIVHEADAQRQHVRVNLPAAITIDGKMFTASDWSNAGMSLSIDGKADMKSFKEGNIIGGVVHFELDSFGINVPMTIETRNIDKKAQTVGLKFIDMTQRQVSIMHHMVNAYVTGEITNVNDLIHVVGRNNMSNPRKIPSKDNDGGFDIGNLVRKGVVACLSFLLFAYVAIAIYDQAYVVEAQSATVVADGFPVLAPAQGVVGYKGLTAGTKISKGEALLTVLSDTGTITSADSPCDCIVTDQLVDKGAVVSKNEAILTLIPQNAPLYIEAFVPYEQALNLTKDQSVMVSGKGNAFKMPATIESIQLQKGAANNARVKLSTDGNIPADTIGMPIEVRFDTLGWAF